VVLTYNRRAEVLTSLGHLTNLPEQPRIVLVDNGSTDGTAAAVAQHFPQVEIVEAGGNLGGAGRTLGVRHLETPYVAFCDDDTWWEPGGLNHAANLMDAHPCLAIITARVLVGPEEREDPTCRLMAQSPLPRQPGMPGPSLLGFLAGASVIRRSAFLEAGGFEPRLLIGGEEELLAADLATAGWWLCYVPELTVHHYPSHHREGHTRHCRQVRNALLFAWLRRPVVSAIRRTVSLGLRDRTALCGMAKALAGLPWVLRRRRVVPPEIEARLRLLER
jgi:GT2 family glycosyltransferase